VHEGIFGNHSLIGNSSPQKSNSFLKIFPICAMHYLILQHPGHNWVYYQAAEKLAVAELNIALWRFQTSCKAVSPVEIAGVRYIGFQAAEALTSGDINLLSRLSFVFALFQLGGTKAAPHLIPISKTAVEYLDPKISSLLKYKGKTNELFTKMMVNIALLSSDFSYEMPIQLLDPVAGKGTTLFEGLIYGFDVYGVEKVPASVHELNTFFKKYLQTERFKHKAKQRQIAGQKKSEAVDIQEFEFATSKEDFQSGEKLRKLGIVCGDAHDVATYFKKPRFHLIVGDLPYGIVHTNKKQKTASRNPLELLEACLDAWHQVLKPGGSLVIAWNTFVAARSKVTAVFEAKGFTVLDEGPYSEFSHMVDRSIKRDVVVAKKAKA